MKTLIQDYKIEFPKELISGINEWKIRRYNNWSKKDVFVQSEYLEELIIILALGSKTEIPKTKQGMEYRYFYRIKEIEIDKYSPSIVSTFHEFAHHLNGTDEQQVILWSINLFKKCFPRSFKALKWDPKQNLLVKK